MLIKKTNNREQTSARGAGINYSGYALHSTIHNILWLCRKARRFLINIEWPVESCAYPDKLLISNFGKHAFESSKRKNWPCILTH